MAGYAGADKPQSTLDEIKEGLGDISEMELFANWILVGVWIRAGTTKGGIILTDKTLNEDVYQGKVGFVLKKGPLAFVPDARVDFGGMDVTDGDCILYRVSDGFQMDINGIHCRLLEDTHVKMRVPSPSLIY